MKALLLGAALVMSALLLGSPVTSLGESGATDPTRVPAVVSAMATTPSTPAARAGAVESMARVDKSAVPGAEFAQTISLLTGVAISPLLGTGAVGAWRYFRTDAPDRHRLPWFAQPWFWIPALLLVGVIAAKDILGPATPTTLKKPIDVAEAVENKISGLIAAGAFVPLIMGAFGDLDGSAALDVAGAGFAAATGSQFVNILLTPLAIAVFAAVWLLGHVINVFILLSPFTTVDLVLKLMRTALLGLLAATSFAGPWIGAVFALVVIVAATFLAGWSFRLTLLGAVFITDVLSRRRRWFRPDPRANWMFLARGIGDAPLRTYGKVTRDDSGALRFRYRPFLIGRARETILPPGTYCIGRGFIYADLLKIEGGETLRHGILPPRYKNHEEHLTEILRLAPPQDVGIRAVLRVLGEMLGFGAGPVPAGGTA